MGSIAIQPRKIGADYKRLTPNQRLFVEHLLANPQFDTTAAARAAGYASPQSAGAKLVRHKVVRAILGKALQERITRCELQADQVLSQLAAALFLDPLDLFERTEDGSYVVRNLEDIPPHVRRCITKLKARTRQIGEDAAETLVEIELMSKDAALPLAMKHLGLAGPAADGSVQINVSGDILAGLLERVEKTRAKTIDTEFIEHVSEDH